MASKDAGSAKEEDEKWCPCGIYNKAEDKSKELFCPECNTWWHIACSGWSNLSLTPAKMRALKWKCPRCVVLKLKLVETPKSSSLSLEDMAEAQAKKMMPKIMRIAAEEALKQKHYTKSVSDANKASQKEFSVIAGRAIEKHMDAALSNNQKQLLEKAAVSQDADNIERQKRKRNVVLSGVPESTETSAMGRIKADLKKIQDIVQPQNGNTLLSCFRAGRKRPNRPRLLIVTVQSPAVAEEFHGYGSGRRHIAAAAKQ